MKFKPSKRFLIVSIRFDREGLPHGLSQEVHLGRQQVSIRFDREGLPHLFLRSFRVREKVSIRFDREGLPHLQAGDAERHGQGFQSALIAKVFLTQNEKVSFA